MTLAEADPKSRISSYEDHLAYFENVGECLGNMSKDDVNNQPSMLDDVCNEMMRSLRESILVLTVNETSKAFEKIIHYLTDKHILKIWLVLTGKIVTLTESKTGSFIIQSLLRRTADVKCLEAIVTELAYDKKFPYMVWSLSGSHVLASIFLQLQQVFVTGRKSEVKEKADLLVNLLSSNISLEIEQKQLRAMRNQAPSTVLRAMCLVSANFEHIGKVLHTKAFKIGGKSAFKDHESFLRFLVENNHTCRVMESLFAGDFDLAAELIFECQPIETALQLRLPAFFAGKPLDTKLMHLFASMISHAPLDGKYSLISIWTAIFTRYAHHLIEKDQYAVVFAILERNVRHYAEGIAANEEISDEVTFFRMVRIQVRNLLKNCTTLHAAAGNTLPCHGTAHMLISESLRDDQDRSKYGLHLLYLLMKLESYELRQTFSTIDGLSEKQKWFFDPTHPECSKDSMPLLFDFLATPSEFLRKLALDPEGSRLLQLIWSLVRLQDEFCERHSSEITIKSSSKSSRKRQSCTEHNYPRLCRFARRFRKYLTKLACDSYGSHFIELFVADAKDIPELLSITSTLSTNASMRELRSSMTGRLLIRKFGLEQVVKS